MSGAAIFDLDKTLLSSSVSIAFSGAMVQAGLLPPRDLAKGAVAGAIYQRFGASSDAIVRAKDSVAALIRGIDVEQFLQLIDDNFDEVIPPLVYEEGRQLIAGHRAAGRAVVIASSSGEEAVGRVGAMLGADHVIATRSETLDGRYTGEIPFFAFAQVKAQAVAELAHEQGWDLAECYAYSDSHTDLPMLELVGHPFVVNPDRSLRQEAEERGWPVLTFSRARRHNVAQALPGQAARTARDVAAGTAGGVTSAAVRAVGGLWGPANRVRRTLAPRLPGTPTLPTLPGLRSLPGRSDNGESPPSAPTEESDSAPAAD